MAQTNDEPFSEKKLHQKAEFSRWLNSQPKDDDGFTIIGDCLIAVGNDSTEDMEAAWNASRLSALDDCKTTLKWQFGEWAKISNDSKEKGEGFRQGIMKAVEIIDAELEALRKKVEK